jgi:predicted RNA-binding Zn-ribbon protein involved in translation (DUF1610 family)
MQLANFLDAMSERLYGRKLTDAQTEFICVRCGESVYGRLSTRDEWNEYTLSGYCPPCAEIVFADFEEDEA